MDRVATRALERALCPSGPGKYPGAACDRHRSHPRHICEIRGRQRSGPLLGCQVELSMNRAGAEILGIAADRVTTVGHLERRLFDTEPKRRRDAMDGPVLSAGRR